MGENKKAAVTAVVGGLVLVLCAVSGAKADESTEDNDEEACASIVGGYGELNYNHINSRKETDVHRLALFAGHRYSPRVCVFSELEIEHAQRSKENGRTLRLEEAYAEFTLNEQHKLHAGIFPLPVGLTNEADEPGSFYGVEVNAVESNILPVSSAAALQLSAKPAPNIGYEVSASTGLRLPTSGDDAYKLSVASRNTGLTKDGMLGVRVSWKPHQEISMAAALRYQGDSTLGRGGAQAAASATLAELEAELTQGALQVRALYAAWRLSGAEPAALGRDRQNGWYIEPAYKVTPSLGLFTRYGRWNNSAGAKGADSDAIRQWDVGANYWLDKRWVLKVDVQNQSVGANDDGFNLGVGYEF